MLITNLDDLNVINSNVKDSDIKKIVLKETNQTLFKEVAEVKRTVKGSLYAANMALIEVKLIGSYSLFGKELKYIREVTANGRTVTIDYGTFTVEKNEYDDSTKQTTLLCFDNMIKAQKEYNNEYLDITYPTTVYNVYKAIVELMGVGTLDTNIPNGSIPVEMDFWSNAEFTYRDILNQIAQVSGSIISIKDEKVSCYQPKEYNFTIHPNKLKTLKVGEKYGKINILNITREPQHDNYPYPLNWSSIPVEDRKELVFENNDILNLNRESLAPIVFDKVDNVEYTTFETDTFGFGIFDIGDVVTLEEFNTGKTYSVMITEEVSTHKHQLLSSVKSSVPLSNKDRYVVATDQRREGQRTYILVDQLNGKITLALEDIGELKDNYAKIELEIDKINQEVQSMNTESSVIPNLNGSMDFFGWEFGLSNTGLRWGDRKRWYKDMRWGSNFAPVEVHSLSQFGLKFVSKGKAISPFGYIVPNSIYSYRGRRFSGNQYFNITVIEYNENKEEIKRTLFNLNEPKQYESFTLQPAQNTFYARLEFETLDDNELILTEQMFNRGNPTTYKESAGDIQLWAQAQFEITNNSITSIVNEVSIIDGIIQQNSSEISQLSNKIVLGVNSDGRVVQMSLGADPNTGSYFIIKADSIALEGLTTINNGFKVLPNGDVIMVNAEVTGKINATSGKIGGFTIENDNLVGNQVSLKPNEITFDTASIKSWTESNSIALNASSVSITGYNTSHFYIGQLMRMTYSEQNKHAFAVMSSIRPTGLETNGQIAQIGSGDYRYDYIWLKNQPNVSSDIRYKRNITDIDDMLLDEFEHLKRKSFTTKHDDKYSFGYIAQDVERCLYKFILKVWGYSEANQWLGKFKLLSRGESYLSLLYAEVDIIMAEVQERKIKRLQEENRLKQEQHEQLQREFDTLVEILKEKGVI